MKKKKAKRHRKFTDMDRRIDRALNQAARDAVRQHKIAGQPMAVWRDGKAIWVSPDGGNSKIDGKKRRSRRSRNG